MIILMLIFLAVIIGLIVFITKIFGLINNNNDEKSVITFFKKYIKVIFAVLFAIYAVLMALLIIQNKESMYVIVYFAKFIIEITFLIIIYKEGKKLLNNIENNVIFDHKNVLSVTSIGKQFLLLTLVEIITGLFFGVVSFVTNGKFTLTTNPVMILFIAIGLIMLIVSFILKKAIEIYEENKLTIWLKLI